MDAAIALKVFKLLEDCDHFDLERHEVASPAFSNLRLGVRELILTLRDSEDEYLQDQVVRLQRLLAEWLTTPCSFLGDASDELLNALSEVEQGTSFWGNSVASHLDRALAGAGMMASGESALQSETREVLTTLLAEGLDFRIYCHRTARQHFLNLLGAEEQLERASQRFLHSPRDYRDSRPFDVLVKIGALRSEGWGAVPSALLSAPRYRKLLQILWSSTSDEPRFGADPILGDSRETLPGVQTGSILNLPGGIRWRISRQHSGEDDELSSADQVDDLTLLSMADVARLESRRPALMLLTCGNRGVMYPPNATVLVFDTTAAGDAAFREAQVNEDVAAGMFLVWPRVQEEGSRTSIWAAGHYHSVWKSVLAEELARDSAALARRLRAAGLGLAHLESAARHWAKAPTTVIHAPQLKRHFDVLMKVLGVTTKESDRKALAAAWQEIRRSRGEAIQAGVQEHSRLVEMSIQLLRRMRPEVLLTAQEEDEFTVLVPADATLFGTFFFMKIEGIEEGYRVPDTELRQVFALDEAVKWRA